MSNANSPMYPTSIPDRLSQYSELEFCLAGGLTKREYFAIMVMQGMVGRTSINNVDTEPRLVATAAIVYADELLKQLEVQDE